jgi:hypothetical protein
MVLAFVWCVMVMEGWLGSYRISVFLWHGMVRLWVLGMVSVIVLGLGNSS